MKSKIILMLVISSLIIGCIDSTKSISSNNIIPETISSITDKFVKECGKSLTTEQCDYWVENNVNNKYISGYGTIKNVRDGIVYINVNYKYPYVGSQTYDAIAIIKLHDLSKEELLNNNINNNIQFSGKINIKKSMGSYKTSWIMMVSPTDIYGVDLYNSKIIQISSSKCIENEIKSGGTTGSQKPIGNITLICKNGVFILKETTYS